ncbi:YbaK/EbsC family protein [Euzebya sp.]|uniref:YbaK/EbsC family protein n=1 Tax=Euzebya sp. TaxID=1971409 RepID=UPI0035151E5A
MADETTPAHAELEQRVIALATSLDPDVEVIRIDPDLADTAAFCDAYGYELEESGNCILVSARTGEAAHAACLVQATRRLDLNRHSRLVVGARKASFATPEDTVAVTGMIPGGVTPIGLPPGLPLFIDAPITELDRVIVGGGGRAVKLRLSPAALVDLPGATVADIGRD